jgi:hypothetical protein
MPPILMNSLGFLQVFLIARALPSPTLISEWERVAKRDGLILSSWRTYRSRQSYEQSDHSRGGRRAPNPARPANYPVQ